jgi:hypothetical protein
MPEPITQPGDIVTSATLAVTALRAFEDRDWSVPAGDLEWSCRRTLDHIVDTLLLYGSYLATQATERRSPIRNGDPQATVADLLDALDASARMLELICEASPPPVRAFHPSGYSDADGFRAMACSEILTHTDDILQGFGSEGTWQPPQDLCERILRRVFPWAPDAGESPDRWQAVRWACGRTALPGHPRLDEHWWWHAAPIAEWDGTRNERTAPPAWS